MITVIAMALVFLILVTVSATIATNSLTSSRQHASFEGALSVAEAGVDQTLARVQKGAVGNRSDYVTPGPGDPSCDAPTLSTPSFSTEIGERIWARDTILGLAASNPGCLQGTGEGQFLAVQPSNRQTVYSMGWSPGLGVADAKRRLVKAEWLFSPYRPVEAVLTAGNLSVSGSVFVGGGVHTNGNFESTASSLEVNGDVTATGTYSVGGNVVVGTGSGGSKPQESLPEVSARSVYNQLWNNPEYADFTTNWYDLCADGTVRPPSSAGPCSSTTVLADVTEAGQYRGWEFEAASGSDPAVWETNDATYPGTYYVFQGNAEVKAMNGSYTATVIAEAQSTGAGPCDTTGGNIYFQNTEIHPYFPGLMMLADTDLTGQSNSDAGSGLFVAGDTVNMQTSSSTITGAIVARDRCATDGDTNSLQGVHINFDSTAEVPLLSMVRTTQWLEFVG